MPEPDHLDTLLGIDPNDPQMRLARQLTEADHGLINSLIHARRTAGLTAADVARRMGVSEGRVRELERFDCDPCLSMLRRYALAIGVRITHDVTQS